MGIPISLGSKICASPDQVSSVLGNTQSEQEAVILHLANGNYYGLNPVGAFIWTLIKEPQRVASIAEAIQNEFEVDADRCQQDLLQLLAEMEAAGLVQVANPDPA